MRLICKMILFHIRSSIEADVYKSRIGQDSPICIYGNTVTFF